VFHLKRGTVIGTAICVLSLTVGLCGFAQDSTSARGSVDPGAEQLENVQIQAEGIAAFFGELSLRYDIPIGLETAVNESAFTPYSIDFKKGTLVDLLTQFVSQHSLYAWKIEDGVVSVFPTDAHRDFVAKQLLEVKIRKFSVKEKTSCSNLVENLVAQPEAKRVLAANNATFNGIAPSGFYIQNVGRRFMLEVSDVTLKSILNKVVSKSSTARFWVITRNLDKTLLIDIAARHEDSPRTKGKSSLQQLLGTDRPIQ
jgi:hypothetical protein